MNSSGRSNGQPDELTSYWAAISQQSSSSIDILDVFYEKIQTGKTLKSLDIASTNTVNQNGKQFTIYSVKVYTDMGDYTVDKRYREFRNLRNQLKEEYRNLDVSEFPRKKIFSSLKQSTVEYRVRMLNVFLNVVFEHYQKTPREWKVLAFIDIANEFRKKGIFEYFRDQANSTIILREKHADLLSELPLQPNSDQEEKMIEILQKLNAFSESAIKSFEKMRNFYFIEKPALGKRFIPLILFGEGNLKGLMQVSLRQSKEDSHFVCCQGLKLLIDLMDIQMNPSAQQFIDVYTLQTFKEMKEHNFRSHILNKQQKDCKGYAIKLLRIYIDTHEKNLTKVTRSLFLDDKCFEEYVRQVKIQNVPRQLLNKVLLDLMDEDQSGAYIARNSNNPHQQYALTMKPMQNQRPTSLNPPNRGSHQIRSYDFRERFMFKRDSVLDKDSNTFFEPLDPDGQNTCEISELKDAVDDPCIDWSYVYQHPTNGFKNLKLLSLNAGQSGTHMQAMLQTVKCNKRVFKLQQQLIESVKIGVDDQQRVVGKETLRFQRYTGSRMLTFLFTTTAVFESGSLYWMLEPSDYPNYKPSANEDMGQWQRIVKFKERRSQKKVTTAATMEIFGDDEEGIAASGGVASSSSVTTPSISLETEITILIRCCDNNSMVFFSPFLLNDDKSMVEKLNGFVESVNKQQMNVSTSCKSTFDHSLAASQTSASSMFGSSYLTPMKQAKCDPNSLQHQ